MKRIWLFGLLTAMLLASAAAPMNALAQETTPGASGDLLNLPAMMILPFDVEGEGYGIMQGVPLAPEAGSSDEVRLGDYSLRIGLPDPNDPNLFARAVRSSVTQFTDVERAEIRFAGQRDSSAIEVVEGTHSVGDGSVIDRSNGTTTDTGTPWQSLRLTFWIETLVAEVDVVDYAGGEPTIDEVEALAEIMAERIEKELDAGSPPLSTRLLRLENGNDFAVQYSSLEVPIHLDGRTARFFYDSDESMQHRADVWGESAVLDVYQNEQYLQPDGTNSQDEQLAFASRVYRFETENEAEAYVETAVQDAIENPGDWTNVEEIEVSDVSGFDGAAGGFSYDLPLSESATSSGVRIVTQVDRYVLTVEADIPGGVTVEGVEELAAAQIACFEEEKRCAPVTVRDGLVA